MSDFSEALASLCSRELIASKNDPDRRGEMIERLAHSLSWTIAVLTDSPRKAAEMCDGVTQYIVETTAGFEHVVTMVRRPE